MCKKHIARTKEGISIIHGHLRRHIRRQDLTALHSSCPRPPFPLPLSASGFPHFIHTQAFTALISIGLQTIRSLGNRTPSAGISPLILLDSTPPPLQEGLEYKYSPLHYLLHYILGCSEEGVIIAQDNYFPPALSLAS